MARKTTVILPDGTAATRKSATRRYEWAVQVTTDLHAKAHRLLAAADRAADQWARMDAIVTSGDLTRFNRQVTSSNGYGERFYSSFLPGDNRDDSPGYWLPDYADKRSWADYAPQALAEAQARPQELREQAGQLLAGTQFAYVIVRWSARRDSADQAVRSLRLFPEQSATVVSCQEV